MRAVHAVNPPLGFHCSGRLQRPLYRVSTCQTRYFTSSPGHHYADPVPKRSSAALDEWVQREARPISLRQLTFFGRTLSKERLLSSAKYVQQELPVRLAHRIRDMQLLPYSVLTNSHISHVYDIYWSAFDKFRSVSQIRTLQDNERYCALLKETLTEHLTAIPRLARGVLEVNDLIEPEVLDKFMTTLLRSRISRRVIAEQHLALTESFQSPWLFPGGKEYHDPNADFIGEIFLKCKAKEVVETCATTMRSLMREAHGPEAVIPEVEVSGHLEATFPYILSHLEYIIGELLRNSMQAVIERYRGKVSTPPPVKVLIVESSQHVMFRIEDQGGGIPREIFRHLWSFAKGPRRDKRLENLTKVPKMAATMQELSTSEADVPHTKSRKMTPKASVGCRDSQSSLSSLTSRPPNLRLGIGLPMSKIYAEYWAGALIVHNLEGHGADAFLQISKLGNRNEQLTTRASMDSV